MSTQTRLAKLENFERRGSGAWIALKVFGTDEYLVSNLSGADERRMTRDEIENELTEPVYFLPMKCATVEEWMQQCEAASSDASSAGASLPSLNDSDLAQPSAPRLSL